MTNVEVITEYYSNNFDKIVKRVTRWVPGVMDAEDVVQESFVRALQYEHTFNSALSSVQTWFSNILNNVHRKMKRDEYLATVEIKEEDIYTREADEYEDEEDVHRKIKECISVEKKEQHRNVLFLHLIAGLKVSEVSRQLQIPVESVKTVVKRFKKTMGDRYGDRSGI